MLNTFMSMRDVLTLRIKDSASSPHDYQQRGSEPKSTFTMEPTFKQEGNRDFNPRIDGGEGETITIALVLQDVLMVGAVRFELTTF